jgi:hypothetical protein
MTFIVPKFNELNSLLKDNIEDDFFDDNLFFENEKITFYKKIEYLEFFEHNKEENENKNLLESKKDGEKNIIELTEKKDDEKNNIIELKEINIIDSNNNSSLKFNTYLDVLEYYVNESKILHSKTEKNKINLSNNIIIEITDTLKNILILNNEVSKKYHSILFETFFSIYLRTLIDNKTDSFLFIQSILNIYK